MIAWSLTTPNRRQPDRRKAFRAGNGTRKVGPSHCKDTTRRAYTISRTSVSANFPNNIGCDSSDGRPITPIFGPYKDDKGAVIKAIHRQRGLVLHSPRLP